MSELPKVSLRGGFSDRNQIKPENREIQYKEFDNRTRTSILNLCNRLFELRSQVFDSGEFHQHFIRAFLTSAYNENVSIDVRYDVYRFFENYFNRTILEDDYDSVLTVVEYFVKYISGKYGIRPDGNPLDYLPIGDEPRIIPENLFNDLFEKEFVGYRFVNGLITPITNELEVGAIEEAINGPYDAVNEHLEKALRLISDRENPDYPNSIKESITAVETICILITGLTKAEATLGKLLKHLQDNGINIHGSLKSAFDKLYGYTSDAKGIRHAGNLDGPDATFEEAKYMLISCSAFISYLIGVESKGKDS